MGGGTTPQQREKEQRSREVADERGTGERKLPPAKQHHDVSVATVCMYVCLYMYVYNTITLVCVDIFLEYG